jgi:hypothetical protein
MKRSLAIFALFFALVGSPPTRAQDGAALDRQAAQLQEQGPALQAFLKRSREGQVDPAFASEVLSRAKALEDQGLPTEPYLLKANEGLAKKVGAKRMAPALDQTVSRTRNAAAIVDKSTPGVSADSRRRAILQVQSGLMSGRSEAELEKTLRSHVKPSKVPDLPDLESHSGSEKPSKKTPGFEKRELKAKSKSEFRKQEKSKSGPSKEKRSHSKGKGSGKSSGKGRGK